MIKSQNIKIKFRSSTDLIMSDLNNEDKLIEPEEESNVKNPNEINNITNETQTSS